MPSQTYKRHRRDYLAHMKKNPKAHPAAYFLNVKQRGRPTIFTRDEECLAAEKFAAMGDTSLNADKHVHLAELKRMAQALGYQDFKASRQFWADFKRRSEVLNKDTGESDGTLKETKASNLSHQRAKAMAPEKIATNMGMVEGVYDLHHKQGRNRNWDPEPEQKHNLDEAHPEQGKFRPGVHRPNGANRSYRLVEGEKCEWHGTTFFVTNATGYLLPSCSGVIHQAGGQSPAELGAMGLETSGGGTAALAHGLKGGKDSPFFATTTSGGMDEGSFMRACEKFVYTVGKHEWDKDKSWDQQPADGNHGFEDRPIYLWMDAHYSHTYWKALQFLRDHDVWVFFTVAGLSLLDQVLDCGMNACAWAIHGDLLRDWYLSRPGLKFMQFNYNEIYTKVVEIYNRKHTEKGSSAWSKTGWHPHNREAENYKHMKLNAVTLDDRGSQHVEEEAASGAAAAKVQVLRPKEESVPVVILRGRGGTAAEQRAVVIRKAAFNALNTTVVVPAAENRKVYQEVFGLQQLKAPREGDLDSDSEDSDESDDEEEYTLADGERTNHGALGSAARYIYYRKLAGKKRDRKERRRKRKAEKRRKA